ncbi:MAG: hypothetical protein WCM76_05765 [Bacteroidota bacterium]
MSRINILICTIISVFSCSYHVSVAQNDSSARVKFIEPDNGFHLETFVECSQAQVLVTKDTLWTGDVFLMKNFTDQLLQICSTNSVLPASSIWGYRRNGKYYRSATPFGNIHVFAERIVKGELSLYYCRALPSDYDELRVIAKDPNHPDYHNTMIDESAFSGRYKNDYYYFISPASDSSQMIPVTNKNIDSVAEKYLKNSPTAYNDALNFDQKKKAKIAGRVLLPVGLASYTISLLNLAGPGMVIINLTNPFFYIGVISLGVYAYLRITYKERYLHPNDMIRIISNYNNSH